LRFFCMQAVGGRQRSGTSTAVAQRGYFSMALLRTLAEESVARCTASYTLAREWRDDPTVCACTHVCNLPSKIGLKVDKGFNKLIASTYFMDTKSANLVLFLELLLLFVPLRLLRRILSEANIAFESMRQKRRRLHKL
jgi:hypothetical protein